MKKITSSLLALFIIPVLAIAGNDLLSELLPSSGLLLEKQCGNSHYAPNVRDNSGLKTRLCILKNNVDQHRLEEFVGQSVFTNSAKQTVEESNSTFNHYNPDFFVALQEMFKANSGNPVLRDLYDNYFKETTRLYYYIAKVLKQNPTNKERYLTQYTNAINANQPVSHELMMFKGCPGWHGDLNKFVSSERSWEHIVSVLFWLRRSMDGSADALVGLIESVLSEYDKTYFERISEAPITLNGMCILDGFPKDLNIAPSGEIEELLKKYVDTQGCLLDFDANNVAAFNHRFVALYTLDYRCTGGTAMGQSAIATFEYDLVSGNQQRLFLIPQESFPVASMREIPNTITHFYAQKGELRYEGLVHNFSQDALCCPSQVVSGAIVFENGIWKGHQDPLTNSNGKEQ